MDDSSPFPAQSLQSSKETIRDSLIGLGETKLRDIIELLIKRFGQNAVDIITENLRETTGMLS